MSGPCHRPQVATPDLNLLVTLNVVLSEGSVVRAARRLQLSPSAMSRALARVREATGDPLLVRAGRGFVPTPRAIELKGPVAAVVQEAELLLRPAKAPDLKSVTRTFTLRSREGFVANFGARLITRIAEEAPGVQLHFVTKLTRDRQGLRDGRSISRQVWWTRTLARNSNNPPCFATATSAS